MSAREILKQFIPPLFLDLYRAVTRRAYIWDGVYRTFRDVPVAGPGFNGDALVIPTLDDARQAIRVASGSGVVATEVINEYWMLALLASVARERSGRLRVLDFGGGVGIHYVHLRRALADPSALDYHIVELEWACQAGPRLFPNDGCIHFHSSLPEALPNLDIVHLSGVLPYVEGYACLLKALCAYRAEYILISSLPSGAFETFVSAQKNVPGTVMPCWFFNRDEIVDILSNEGYSLAYKSAVEHSYNQDNLPESHRLDRGRNSVLLFSL